MSIAANAVTDLIAPAPQSVSARDDNDSARFQGHLDAQTTSNDRSDHRPSRTRDTAKQTKPADSSKQGDDVQATQDADDAATDSAQPTEAAAKPDKPAHAVIVQILPQGTAHTPPAAQQQVQAAPQSAPATPQQSAPAQQINSSLLAQVLKARPQPAQTTQASNTPAQKPAKTNAKANKDTAAGASPAAQQAGPQQADTQQVAPTAPPALQVATIAPAAPATNTQSSTSSVDSAAIGVVQAAGQNMSRAADHAAMRAAAPSVNAPTTNAKDDAQKTDGAPVGKTATVIGSAKAAAASAPDFKDLLRAASPGNESSSSASASSISATATQAAPLSDASSADLTAARAAAMPVSAQVAREIVRRAIGDNTRFELRLDPPELGKIQVQLDVSRDHKVTAVVSADNPQALSDLSRGARDLQQALQSAGLDLADDGLSFNLSNPQNGFSQPDQSNSSGNAGASTLGRAAETQSSAETSIPRARPLSIESWRGSRIDMMA